MSIADDLLDHAEDMVTAPHATQAVLRRGASPAYYALFHLIVGDAAALLSPPRPPFLQAIIRRGFQHNQMKDVCKAFARGNTTNLSEPMRPAFADPIETDLTDVAQIFLDLQSLRHIADYAVTEPFSFLQAAQAAGKTRDAFAAWNRVKSTDNAHAFCAAMLLHKSWRND